MGFRYIGAKTQILEEVIADVLTIAPRGGRVVDLMCGTGAVSAALRKKGYRVTAVDVMTYAYHHARIQLLLSTEPTFCKATTFLRSLSGSRQRQEGLFPLSPHEEVISLLQGLQPTKGYFWREFSSEGKPDSGCRPRNYFSPDNAQTIDAMRLMIRKMNKSGILLPLEHSLLLHDLIMAANDVANIAGTYGHYLSKLVGRAKDSIVLKPCPALLLSDEGKHSVVQGYAEDVAQGLECDLCYIDPPYIKRQYAANYHILETLAREDEPEAVGMSGLRPWRDQYSNFCTKTKIRDSFRKIFGGMRCKEFLVSYSQDGLLGLDDLRTLCSEFGKTKVRMFKNKRFRSNQSPLAPKLTEYLLHLTVN